MTAVFEQTTVAVRGSPGQRWLNGLPDLPACDIEALRLAGGCDMARLLAMDAERAVLLLERIAGWGAAQAVLSAW